MNVFDTIDSLVSQANTIISQKQRKHKVKLYAEGLTAKLTQVEYSLHKLYEHKNKTDHDRTSTIPSEFTITDKVYFYSDAFWAFLYSSLDVLAHVVNQALELKLDERDVSFKKIKTTLDNKKKGTAIQKAFTTCMESNIFRNLDNYRNCSTHRRQIFIKEVTTLETHTGGYDTSTTGPIITVTRTLCENPLRLNPTIKQKRRIPDYMEKTKNKIILFIEQILKKTKPVR